MTDEGSVINAPEKWTVVPQSDPGNGYFVPFR